MPLTSPMFHGRALGRRRDRRIGPQRYTFPHQWDVELPVSTDLRPLYPPIYDQGQEGSCTGNAVAGECHKNEMVQHAKVVITPARQFLYFNSRVRLEGADPHDDTGSTIADAVKSAAQFGYPDEPLWPYDVAHFAKQPPTTIYQKALPQHITDYARIPDNSEKDIKAALVKQHGIVLGVDVYSNWPMEGNGDVPMPKGELEGGHAIILVGYNDKTKLYNFRNSWGVGWGARGYGRIPYAYVHSKHASDFWIISKVPLPAPKITPNLLTVTLGGEVLLIKTV